MFIAGGYHSEGDITVHTKAVLDPTMTMAGMRRGFLARVDERSVQPRACPSATGRPPFF
jgi:hypothetical protein